MEPEGGRLVRSVEGNEQRSHLTAAIWRKGNKKSIEGGPKTLGCKFGLQGQRPNFLYNIEQLIPTLNQSLEWE